MEKYAHFTKSDFPSFSQYEAWAGADLMIKGLELAGPNPTRANVIKDLRNLKSYNANGLLPQSIDYSTIFGHDPAKKCAWVVQATTTGFKMAGLSRTAARTSRAPRPPTQLHRDEATPGDGANGGFGPGGRAPIAGPKRAPRTPRWG